MLRTAHGKIMRAGVQHRVSVAAGDATASAADELFGRAHYDRVLISYALSMIPPWREAAVTAAGNVAPDGMLHIVDFGNFAGFSAWLHRAQFNWLDRFSVTPIHGLESKLSRLAQSLAFTPTVSRLCGGYTIHARLRRCG
jgi:S-adenosylmethionine-diacylgycerolhomoserine-N-methlytransferase